MQPWWSESFSAWIGSIGGAGCGVVVGGLGAISGALAPRGIGRKWILSLYILIVVVCVLTAGAGIYAVSTGQPYRVWFPLVLIGVIGTLVELPLFFVVRHRYTQAEMRKMDAGEFRG